MFLRVFRYVLLACICSSLVSAAQTPTSEQITAKMKTISEAIATARKCKWGSALDVQALELQRGEMDAQIATMGDAAVTASTNGMVAGEMAGQAHACTDTAFQGQIQANVNQFMAITILRAKALLDAEAAMPFARGETTLGSYASLVTNMDGTIRQQFSAQYANARAAQDNIAKAALDIVCSERKNIRTKDTRACPALTADEKAHLAEAKALLSSSEKLVAAFAAEAAKRAPAQTAAASSTPSAPEKSPEGFLIYEESSGLAKYGDASDFLKAEHHPYADTEHSESCGTLTPVLQLANKDVVYLTSDKYAYVYAPLGPADGSKPPVWKLYGYLKSEVNAPAVMHLYPVGEEAAIKATVMSWKAAAPSRRAQIADPFDKKLVEMIHTDPNTPISMRRCGIKGKPHEKTASRAFAEWQKAHKAQLLTADKNTPGTGPVACTSQNLVAALDGPGAFSITGKLYRMYFVDMAMFDGGYSQWAVLAESKEDTPAPDGSRKLMYIKMPESEAIGFMHLLREHPEDKGSVILGDVRNTMIETFEMRPMKLSIDGTGPGTWRRCE